MLHSLAQLYFRCIFEFFVQVINRNSRSIVIFDLDNTIYNTWVERIDNRANENQIYARAKIFTDVANRVTQHYKAKDVLIFISSRKLACYPITCRRVLSDFNFTTLLSIILVSQPEEKLIYIKRLLTIKRKVIYYDDLSYGHETGVVSFYDEVINSVKKLPIKYFGFDEIIKLQNGDININ